MAQRIGMSISQTRRDFKGKIYDSYDMMLLKKAPEQVQFSYWTYSLQRWSCTKA